METLLTAVASHYEQTEEIQEDALIEKSAARPTLRSIDPQLNALRDRPGKITDYFGKIEMGAIM